MRRIASSVASTLPVQSSRSSASPTWSLQICGVEGQTQVGLIDDQITSLPERAPVTMRTARAERVIGVSFTDEQIADIFTRLGLEFTQEPGVFTVTPPVLSLRYGD